MDQQTRPAERPDDDGSERTGNTSVEDDRQMIAEEQADEREAESAVADLSAADE